MITLTETALNFTPSMPRPYSTNWREAYGQGTDSPRLSSYQAPSGKPLNFVYESIGLSGGQNVDTAEYPFAYWSSTRLGKKPHSITLKGYFIGSKYIGKRSDFIEALETATDDDNPGYLDLPLWGRFPVVVLKWQVDEASKETGKSKVSIDFIRAGCPNDDRFGSMTSLSNGANITKAVDALKETAVTAFEDTVKKSKDVATLAAGFGELTNKLASIVGRVQGAISKINGVVAKINGITNLIAQGVRAPKALAQALVSAVFGIVAGVMEIKNAADETASYFMGSDDDSGDGSSSSDATSAYSSGSSSSEQFIKRNEKNVLMNFITANNFELSEEAITEQQYITKTAVENLFKTLAFGAAAQLLTQLEPEEQTYESIQGLWTLLEKLEESIDKENPDVYAAVEETRIACAEVLLSYEYDTELEKHIRSEMPLLALAVYLGCNAEKIRTLNSIADSFLIQGDVIYV